MKRKRPHMEEKTWFLEAFIDKKPQEVSQNFCKTIFDFNASTVAQVYLVNPRIF